VASRVHHIARIAVQDWRTSKIRSRSAISQDPLLRLIYLEILFALHESGGRLPGDPVLLSDILLIPAPEIARCLPILLGFGESGRGGLLLDGSYIHNARVDEDLEEENEYRLKQAERGRKRHQPPLSHRSATAQPPLNGGSAAAEAPLVTHKRPLSQPRGALSLPLPLPLPTPPPSPLPTSSQGSTVVSSSVPEDGDPSNEPLGFAEFWEAYPRKAGKGAARKAAKRAPGWPGREKVIQAAKAQAAGSRWRAEPDYIPHPSTWLNQERWADALPSTSGGAQTPSSPGTSLKILRGQVEEVYREQFRAGRMSREDLDCAVSQVRKSEDRAALYRTLDELRTDHPVRISANGEAVL
jgi:hypothetical protein